MNGQRSPRGVVRQTRGRLVRRGDHLRADRGGYSHHGIGLGNGYVVHYAADRLHKRTATIRVSPFEEFRRGGRVRVVTYARCYHPDVVVARAFSRRGERRYHLAENNCEHFARWCKTGQNSSEQVRVVAANVGGSVAGALSIARSIASVSASGSVEGLSGPGVLSGLRTIGAGIGVGAAGALGLLATAPAVAATVAVHHRYADDPYAPGVERRARRGARASGTAGAIGGGAMSVTVVSALGIPGLSGPGIATGLASLGALVGGGMVAGIAIVIGLPIVTAAIFARESHRNAIAQSRVRAAARGARYRADA
jgi:hypothetical protein